MRLKSDGTKDLFDDFIFNSNISLENGVQLVRQPAFDTRSYTTQKSVLTSVKYDFLTKKWLEGFRFYREFMNT